MDQRKHTADCGRDEPFPSPPLLDFKTMRHGELHLSLVYTHIEGYDTHLEQRQHHGDDYMDVRPRCNAAGLVDMCHGRRIYVENEGVSELGGKS